MLADVVKSLGELAQAKLQTQVEIASVSINDNMLQLWRITHPLTQSTAEETLKDRVEHLQLALAGTDSPMWVALNTFPHGRAVVQRARDILASCEKSMESKTGLEDDAKTIVACGEGNH